MRKDDSAWRAATVAALSLVAQFSAYWLVYNAEGRTPRIYEIAGFVAASTCTALILVKALPSRPSGVEMGEGHSRELTGR